MTKYNEGCLQYVFYLFKNNADDSALTNYPVCLNSDISKIRVTF